MIESIKEQLITLYREWAKESPTNIELLPASGSSRQYYRITGSKDHIIGVYNDDVKENKAFISFTQHFLSKGLMVPEIYAISPDTKSYIQKDLGDETLFSFINRSREDDDFPQELIDKYKQILSELCNFQIKGSEDFDYSICYPRSVFDKQSMMWDLSYFKYYFLKLAGIAFDEQSLEDDYNELTSFLLKENSNYFLYRDFQSRNIMIKDGTNYYIDYQGGRKGALQYDVASLLYDAKANIPQPIRNELLDSYIDSLSNHIDVNRDEFKSYYYGFVLIRIMQAMGAYGFRGFYEKKDIFLNSIPYALDNLSYLLETVKLPIELPTLLPLLQKLTVNEKLRSIGKTKLKVCVNSFSYRRGIPVDETGNGGGFVFDCRFLHNPGRYDQYKALTGNDQPVIAFLEEHQDVSDFLSNIYGIIDAAVSRYSKRNFAHLMISFGCTGGQHRSVYCANKIAQYLNDKYDVTIELRHREQEMIANRNKFLGIS